jgi:hypothetical protein
LEEQLKESKKVILLEKANKIKLAKEIEAAKILETSLKKQLMIFYEQKYEVRILNLVK